MAARVPRALNFRPPDEYFNLSRFSDDDDLRFGDLIFAGGRLKFSLFDPSAPPSGQGSV